MPREVAETVIGEKTVNKRTFVDIDPFFKKDIARISFALPKMGYAILFLKKYNERSQME